MLPETKQPVPRFLSPDCPSTMSLQPRLPCGSSGTGRSGDGASSSVRKRRPASGPRAAGGCDPGRLLGGGTERGSLGLAPQSPPSGWRFPWTDLPEPLMRARPCCSGTEGSRVGSWRSHGVSGGQKELGKKTGDRQPGENRERQGGSCFPQVTPGAGPTRWEDG